jgi:protein gp37
MAGNPNKAMQAAYRGLVTGVPGNLDWNGTVRVLPNRLDEPLHWRKPRRVFVNSLSDLFHKSVPKEYINKVFDVMRKAHWHQFQVLTKRSSRLRTLSAALPWPDNVWMGVSVENNQYAFRIDDLRATGAKVKFLSLEPLLGPLPHLDLTGIDWVIVGGETGPGARQMKAEWTLDIRDQCIAAGVPFFFKQWGVYNADGAKVGKKNAGRLLDGRLWEEMPS